MQSDDVHRIRHIIFLRDVLALTLMAVGGPHAHLPLFLQRLVQNRNYLSEAELLELNALCQILPGPTSTQTIIAIGYKLGGARLAYLTLLVWAFPSAFLLFLVALALSYASGRFIDLSFLTLLEPVAVGLVLFAAIKLTRSVIHTRTSWIILLVSAVFSVFLRSPYVTPVLLILGGLATTWKYKEHTSENFSAVKIDWSNFILFLSVFVVTFAIGLATQSKIVKLFESFYRNGSMVFGGGQVLIPMLHAEYVELKKYLSENEFLIGYSLIHAAPGPLFSISSYIGALALRDEGWPWQILGSLVSSLGIFLPGTFLIFFVSHFWSELKKSRFVKASLEGLNAVSTGMVWGVAIYLGSTIPLNPINIGAVFVACILMLTEKVHVFFIIGLALLVGLFIQ